MIHQFTTETPCRSFTPPTSPPCPAIASYCGRGFQQLLRVPPEDLKSVLASFVAYARLQQGDQDWDNEILARKEKELTAIVKVPAVIPELERRVAITDVTEKEERGRHGENREMLFSSLPYSRRFLRTAAFTQSLAGFVADGTYELAISAYPQRRKM